MLPKIFGSDEYDGIIKKLFMEIKKPSESPPKLLKTNHSIALRTSFQALLYWHVDVRKNRNNECVIIDDAAAHDVINQADSFAKEIIKNDEAIWLQDLRWYRSSHDVRQPPKSSILWFLFCLESIIKWHCEVAFKIIQTKRNTENFLDEYGTRWVSYSDLIMMMEEEMWFIEETINRIYESKHFASSKSPNDDLLPKYSILRMMCRIWGKYVTKKLIPAFIIKIREMLCRYHEQILSIGENYEKIIAKKYGVNSLKQKWTMGPVTRDLLMQSVQMIVDISLNEISINYLESTKVQLGKYYPEVEDIILSECENFLGELSHSLKPYAFEKLTSLYFKELKSVFPKTTQRKLNDLVIKSQISRCERVIQKWYDDFMKDQLSDLDVETSDQNLPAATLSKRFSDSDLRLILGKHEQERISELIQNIVAKCHHSSLQNGGPRKFPWKTSEKSLLQGSFQKSKSHSQSQTKELAATFFLHVMTLERDIVVLLNSCHKTIIRTEKEYDDMDDVIQQDNITRRIPEHLDEEDKKKFELIRQGSSMINKDFYKQYIEPEALELSNKSDSALGNEESKYDGDPYDFDGFDDLDEIEDEFDMFADNIDSLILSSSPMPLLTKK